MLFPSKIATAGKLRSASEGWLESNRPVTRRSYQIIAICGEEGLSSLDSILRSFLGPRNIKRKMTMVTDGTTRHLQCLTLRFEADDAERGILSKLVHRLGFDPVIRHVRWESVPS